ncbi:histidine kinase [Rossellomorea aquimaris]|uniref:histidine kinase n=1 Tax=Rossellomorea aquimaris TaxID=189382 RepID=UPI001CD6C502|nr:histidine kinase [Rossellomorea aquimaris]MCA1055949.1 histidine kinase [Rossellomorea aquimaris]
MKKRIIFMIPIMLVVFLVANSYLGESFKEIPSSTRTWIALGGTLVSGVISFFLFKPEGEQEDQ